jgi:hypothetical protein
MLDMSYHRALCDAQLLMPDAYYAGMSIWRERGIEVANLLLDQYLAILREFTSPTVEEHDFLMQEQSYRKVFPDYNNVHTAELPGATSERFVMRPDNMQASVSKLVSSGCDGPVVAVGGILREFRGSVVPLFRERYIWPAVQVTQLVPDSKGVAVLDEHQRALERLFRSLAIPVVSIRTDALSNYGSPCYLTVTCLTDGRPTILSTSYVMSAKYRSALGVSRNVLDIGFTGKVIALVALHHRDHRGLALPSALTPVQLGLVSTGSGMSPEWLAKAQAAGVRTDSQDEDHPTRTHRSRAERRWHRLGTPLIAHTAPNEGVRLTERFPLHRRPLNPGTDPVSEIRRALDEYDERLRSRAENRFQRAMRHSQILQPACSNCVGSRDLPVFGWITPRTPEPCSYCSRTGELALISEQGRFY